MDIDSRTTFEVWQFMIYDEALSQAVFDGTYPQLAADRGYTAVQIAALDWFAHQPGMRWNVENLRFRAALETGAALSIHLPKTSHLLTRGDDNWLQDICYEYLAHYRWDALGHRRLTECERFATYLRERIMRRRIVPQHLEHVLALELAVIGVVKSTAQITAWPSVPALDDVSLAAHTPIPGPAQRVFEQPIDLRKVMTTAKPAEIEAGPGPVTWLIHIPDPRHSPRMKIVGEGPLALLALCDGQRTTREIAAVLHAELDLAIPQVMHLLKSWLADGVLVVAPT